MVAVNLPAETKIELHNESKIHASFCDFERRDPATMAVTFEFRIVLDPDERRPATLKAGTIYITPGRGVVIHGL